MGKWGMWARWARGWARRGGISVSRRQCSAATPPARRVARAVRKESSRVLTWGARQAWREGGWGDERSLGEREGEGEGEKERRERERDREEREGESTPVYLRPYRTMCFRFATDPNLRPLTRHGPTSGSRKSPPPMAPPPPRVPRERPRGAWHTRERPLRRRPRAAAGQRTTRAHGPASGLSAAGDRDSPSRG